MTIEVLCGITVVYLRVYAAYIEYITWSTGRFTTRAQMQPEAWGHQCQITTPSHWSMNAVGFNPVAGMWHRERAKSRYHLFVSIRCSNQVSHQTSACACACNVWIRAEPIVKSPQNAWNGALALLVEIYFENWTDYCMHTHLNIQRHIHMYYMYMYVNTLFINLRFGFEWWMHTQF